MRVEFEAPDRRYGVGWLHQACEACKAWQAGHRIELVRCPACGAVLPAQLGLEFGGMLVERLVSGFMLHGNSGNYVRLHRLDVPDVVRFIAAHEDTTLVGALGERDRFASAKLEPAAVKERFPHLQL